MNAVSTLNPKLTNQIRDDVRQLARPIHIAAGGRIVTHSGLLDQLREATRPGSSPDRGQTRRTAPKSSPPAQLDALDALGTLCLEVAQWHARLQLDEVPQYRYGCEHGSCRAIFDQSRRLRGPKCERFAQSGVDYFKYALWQLVHASRGLLPEVGEWLALDVREWWRSAAVCSGWQPAELLRVR